MATCEAKALSMLSIAAKAGKVFSGSFMCEKAVAEGTACLIIVAGDAAKNTMKKFVNKSKYYEVPLLVFSDSETLGRQIGKQSRTVIAISDEGLAKQIMSKVDSSKDMEV